MRGNPKRYKDWSSLAGSIPAYAGEPSRNSQAAILRAVYPRVCGGTAYHRIRSAHNQGLSPRMRGNPPSGCQSETLCRSIPAYAGEPSGLF